jgi:hypothetical protein
MLPSSPSGFLIIVMLRKTLASFSSDAASWSLSFETFFCLAFPARHPSHGFKLPRDKVQPSSLDILKSNFLPSLVSQIPLSSPPRIHPWLVVIFVRLNRLNCPVGRYTTFDIVAVVISSPFLSQMVPVSSPIRAIFSAMPLPIVMDSSPVTYLSECILTCSSLVPI